MTGISLKSTFGAVTIGGLITVGDLAQALVDAYNDPQVRELLTAAASAAAGDVTEYEGRLDALAAVLPPVEVPLSPDEARHLREQLIGLRLGQGAATASVYGRRIPA